MSILNSLKDTTRKRKQSRRVGRGPSSGNGKTCGRGLNGAGSRSGYRRRAGYEGGQMPLYKRCPTRGFRRTRFQRPLDAINLFQIDLLFKDGEVVNLETLAAHGYLSGVTYGIKILGDGELTKKVSIEAQGFSKSAQAKLEKAGIKFEVVKP